MRQRLALLCCLLGLSVTVLLTLGESAPGLFHLDDEASAGGGSSSGAYPSAPSARSASWSSRREGQASAIDVESLYFENLSEEELADHYSSPPSSTSGVVAQVRALTSRFVETSFIDVLLVGFAGDGDAQLTFDANELQRYLAHAGLSNEQVKQSIRGIGADTKSHALPFATKYLFRINRAPPTLRAKIQTELQAAVDQLVESNPYVVEAGESNRHPRKPGARKPPVIPTIPVPVQLVQSILSRDFKDNGLQTSIYILNLAPLFLKEEAAHAATEGREERTEKVRLRYVYTPEPMPSSATSSSSASSSSAASSSSCPTTHWVSADQRLVWFDLSAGPIAFGPQSWGDGIVTEYSLPNPGRMLENQNRYAKRAWTVARIPLPGGDEPLIKPDVVFTPATTLNSHHRHALLSELALLVAKVTRGLLAPPVDHWAVPYAKRIKVHLVFVHEQHFGESTVETPEQVAAKKASPTHAKTDRLRRRKGQHISSSSHTNRDDQDEEAEAHQSEEAAWGLYPDGETSLTGENGANAWSAIADSLLELSLPEQIIEVAQHHLRFEECEQCVAAYAHALRTHTTNVLYDAAGNPVAPGTPGAQVRTQVHQYLDAAELQDWLEHFDTKYWDMKEQYREGDEQVTQSEELRVVRVFIYDLASTDIVLLDRFHQSVALGDLVLAVQSRATSALVDFSCDGRSLTFDPRDASRAVLGSVLTSGWGVSPSFQSWAPYKNDTENDFLLASGLTPYGYFSTDTRLSFAIKDQARRNILLSDLHASLSVLAAAMPLTSKSRGPPAALVDSVLYASESVDLIRRWNVLTYKLAKVEHWLSLNQVGQAWTYVAALKRDARILGQLITEELTTLRSTLACGEEASPSSGSDSAGALLTASHYLLFVGLEAMMLIGIVGCVWLASSYPQLVGGIVARVVPRALADKLGISRMLQSKHKHF